MPSKKMPSNDLRSIVFKVHFTKFVDWTSAKVRETSRSLRVSYKLGFSNYLKFTSETKRNSPRCDVTGLPYIPRLPGTNNLVDGNVKKDKSPLYSSSTEASTRLALLHDNR
uniref:Ovule protein n=1 Tax=Steinernema glaseri TaxID=37863 RepID=A0A1I7ZNQ6_9BILA